MKIDRIYNEEFKRQYIEDSFFSDENSQKRMIYVFQRAAKKEKEIDKDCSVWSSSEIIDYYKEMLSPSLEFLITTNSYLSKYAGYVLSQNENTDGQNHYKEIDNDILIHCVHMGMLKNKISTREEILNEIKTWNNPSDKFLVLALFEGINGSKHEELAKLKPSDFKDGIAHLPGGDLSVTEELCRFANESAFEEVLHPVKGGGKDMRYAKGDDRIIKPAWNATKEENDNILRRRIISRLRRIKSIKAKNDEDMFSSKALMESGRINMILWYMDEYSCYDLEEILSNKKVVNEVEKRYGKFFSIPRYVLKYQEVFNERT